jgi:hypothetical protein
MRWYWAVDCDNTVDEPYVSDSGDLIGLEEWRFWDGEPVSNWNTSAWLKTSTWQRDGVPDDVLQTHFNVPVYSFRLRNALEQAQVKGIQYLPIRVLRANDSEISGFWIANILNKVAALDLKLSDYERFPADYFVPRDRGEISSLRRTVLKESAVEGYDVIRLAEFQVRVHVSERFKKAFEHAGCTGYSFHSVKVSKRDVG